MILIEGVNLPKVDTFTCYGYTFRDMAYKIQMTNRLIDYLREAFQRGFHGVVISEVRGSIPGRIIIEILFYIVLVLNVCGTVGVSDFRNNKW